MIRKPKYWCKHCSAYVKDTKFERAQHEATGKHQGNLRRFLKGIQDGQERGEREKQRAKAEVDRLNKVVSGFSTSPGAHNVATNRKPSSPSVAPEASITERKKQLAQLAEMGIAVPDEFRGEMAMPGDWKVVSETPVEETISEDPLNVGVRKRKYEGQEEEEAGEVVLSRGWGSTSKRYPRADEGDAPNLDALLSGVKSVKKEETAPELKKEEREERSALPATKDENSDIKKELKTSVITDPPPFKKEEPTNSSETVKSLLDGIPRAEGAFGASIVFKKRKPKSTREK